MVPGTDLAIRFGFGGNSNKYPNLESIVYFFKSLIEREARI